MLRSYGMQRLCAHYAFIVLFLLLRRMAQAFRVDYVVQIGKDI